MFKKKPLLKSQSNVKSSEKRKLFHSILEQYSINSNKLEPSQLTSILPNDIKQSTFKSSNGKQGTIYYNDSNVPIWFKLRDLEDVMIPSLFTLWKCPFILPVVITHDFVIERLINGSNLMIPGLLPPFDNKNLKKGNIVGVINYKNPQVLVGVGILEVDLYKLNNNIEDLKGVAVDVLHIFDDELCKMSKGFKGKILEDGDISETLTYDELHADVSESLNELRLDEKGPETETVVEGEVTEESSPSEEEEIVTPLQKSHEEPPLETPKDTIEDSYTLQPEDVDDFFIRSLLYSITQDNIDIPITSSNFMAKHILKNLEINLKDSINMKTTTWKKTSKFLKAMEKLKLIKIKGKGDDLTVVGLADKTHELVSKFEPYRIKKVPNSSKSISNNANGNKEGERVSIVELFKPSSSSSRLFFNKIALDYFSYYSSTELKGLIVEYINNEKLVYLKDKKLIQPDDILRQMLQLKTPTIERSKIYDALIKMNFTKYYKIINNEDDDVKNNRIKPRKGLPPKIQIIEEMRLGRKILTKVIGIEEFFIDVDEFSNNLKIKCSGSTMINKNIQNPTKMEVSVQGPHYKIVLDLLTNSYGIKPVWIEHENKLKGKKKNASST